MRATGAHMETLLSPPTCAPALARVADQRPPAGRARRFPAWLSLPLPALLPAAGLALWAVASARAWVAPQILPAPRVVLETLTALLRTGELWEHLGPSLARVGLGYAAAAAVGLGGGALLGLSPTAGALVTPLFRAYAHIPVIAWVPVGILLLGIEEPLTVTLVASAAVVPVLASTAAGIRGVSPQLLEVARIYRYRGPRLILRVVAPAALPPVFAGLRQGLSQAWLTLVASELVGTTAGMGYLIVESRELFQLDVVFAALLVLGATGLALDRALSFLESRLLAWRPRGF